MAVTRATRRITISYFELPEPRLCPSGRIAVEEAIVTQEIADEFLKMGESILAKNEGTKLIHAPRSIARARCGCSASFDAME